MTRTRDSSCRHSRMGSLFRKRTVQPLQDDPDDSEADIPLVARSPQLGRQISLQRQTSVPEDSLRYSTTRGNIHFWKNFAYEAEGRPFLCASHDLPPDQVAGVLGHEWCLALPRIALVLLTNVAPLGSALPRRVIDALRRGIIKAANTTEMWILTHGLNVGLAKEVGDAVGAELGRRQAQRCPRHPSRSGAALPPLTLLGVVRDDLLAHADLFDGRQAEVHIENEGNRPEESKYELNPDHSHFLLVRDDTVNKTGLNYFLIRLEQHLASLAESPDREDSVPLVSLLVCGGIGCLRLCLDHLRRQLPLLVLEGSGGLADLLAFAYRQVQRRGPGVWDAEFVESFLKPELTSRLCLLDPTYREKALARNLFRDRVVECVRLACQSDQQAVFMLVDMRSQACNLDRLDEILLKAVFKAQGRAAHSGQRKKDLLLTLDWNCPDVAMTEVFLKDPSCKLQVDWALFEEALVRPDREQFVRMLLDRGFQVHKALTPRRLKRLFQRALNEQFFRSVCWEAILGHSPTSRLGMAFVERELGWLLETLTGLPELVDVQELWMNAALGIYTRGPSAAERRALVLLSLWACCSRRPQLGRLLWQACDQPIQLALLVSMAYQRLAHYAHQGNTRQELLDTSQ
ncbi:transient receptor potential cation channel subfamily M member 7 isoform X1 [Ixodes scapularis]